MSKLIEITGKALSGEWGVDDIDNTGIPVLRTTNFTNEGYIDYSDVVSRCIKKKDICNKLLQNGDIIIEKSGGSDKQPVGRVVFFEGENNKYLFNNFTGLLRVQDTKKWFPKYVFYCLFSNYIAGGTLKFENRTTGLHNLQTDNYVESVHIRDLPIDEQKQIASILDNVCNLISKHKQQLEKLDELVKSRFIELFGGQTFPCTELISLIEEGAGLSYGIIVPGEYYPNGVPMIRPSDFSGGMLSLDNVYCVDPKVEEKYSRTKLKGNEILIQVIGQPGQTMLTDERCMGMNVTRNLAVIRPDITKVNRIYLNEFLRMEKTQIALLGDTNQSTLKQLPLGALKKASVSIPPLDLQNEFAAFVEQTDKLKLDVKKNLEKLETLKKALMQKYFG